MFELFIGDVSQLLADEATKHDKDAVLITLSNVDNFLKTPTGTAYSSIGDIENLDIFLQLCSKADKIYYRPPKSWSTIDSSNKEKQFTEIIIAGLSQYIPVDGVQKIIDQTQYFHDNFLKDTRKTDSSQLWFPGCSITYGSGVSKNQAFKEIIAQELNLEYSDLSQPGSSIIWQSDQICRADIRRDDIVLWGLTSHHRLPVFTQTVIHFISHNSNAKLKFQFPIELLDSTTLMYHNILAVRRAYNFCKKIGARLVILGLIPDYDNIYLHYNVPTFRQLIFVQDQYIDLGTDNIHPGPQTHQMFAKEFLKFYSNLYLTNSVAKN